MLKIMLPGEEVFDESEGKFTLVKAEVEVELEHSLVSVSKWESEFEVAFLGKFKKEDHHIMRYVEHMLLTPLDDPSRLLQLPPETVERIRDYIVADNTATRLLALPGKNESKETVTSELIYYWMIALQIPWEAQYWHLNRLMTLIDLTQRKNSPPKKMGKAEMHQQRAKINAARRRGRPG